MHVGVEFGYLGASVTHLISTVLLFIMPSLRRLSIFWNRRFNKIPEPLKSNHSFRFDIRHSGVGTDVDVVLLRA